MQCQNFHSHSYLIFKRQKFECVRFKKFFWTVQLIGIEFDNELCDRFYVSDPFSLLRCCFSFSRDWVQWFFCGYFYWNWLGTEMEKVGDTGDISLLFFLAGANFWAILGNFWAILAILGHFWAILAIWVIFGPSFGADFLWQNMHLCFLNRFLQPSHPVFVLVILAVDGSCLPSHPYQHCVLCFSVHLRF